MQPDASNLSAAPRAAGFPLAELDYDLPEHLIAQVPAERRSASRLLILDRSTGELQDQCFSALPDRLEPNALLVMNNTRVLPAKFRLQRRTGGKIDGLFLHEREPGLWDVLLRNAARVKPDELLTFVASDEAAPPAAHLPPAEPTPHVARLREGLGEGRWVVSIEPAGPAADVLAQVGRTPLPPYIRRRDSAAAREPLDAERYQTVYATRPGAVAAPTAGLHFTNELLERLTARGIERVELTLHVGLGTFAPIAVNDLADHPMHAEWYTLDAAAAERINRHRAAGGRIVAVGTTSVRVLESCADADGLVHPGSGWTRIFCYPPYRFRAVDALLTNFHLPRSTLLALVMAFAGVEPIRRAYRHAVAQEYRFFSYGDAMFIT